MFWKFVFQALAILQDFHESSYSFDRDFVTTLRVSYDFGRDILSIFTGISEKFTALIRLDHSILWFCKNV